MKLIERTPGEKAAYMAGYEAGYKVGRQREIKNLIEALGDLMRAMSIGEIKASETKVREELTRGE